MTTTNETKTRYRMVDFLRGVAIYLMVFFHFFYDLRVFGHVNIDFQKDFFWFILPRIIVFFFLSCVGMSLCLVHGQGIRWTSFNKRLGKLIIAAILISVFTYFAFPKSWIYFGTLHCIATCSLMALPFLNRPWVSLILGVIVAMSWIVFKVDFPWFKLPHLSMDYIPAVPWIYVVLLGIFAYHRGFHKLPLPQWKILNLIEVPGKYALRIYLLHQPILYGLVYLYSIISSS